MVYITVGSAANPILEFLEEWSTENFEVSYSCKVSQIKFTSLLAFYLSKKKKKFTSLLESPKLTWPFF